MKGGRNKRLLLTALVVVSVSLGTGASAARTPWPPCSATKGSSVESLRAMARGGELRSKLFANICGPHQVIRGVNYSYTVVVTNIGDVNDRVLRVVLTHYDPLTRASLPYRGEPAGVRAVWTRKNLKPGQSFRIGFTLPFKEHNDPKGSNFDVKADRSSMGLGTYDVVFIPRPS